MKRNDDFLTRRSHLKDMSDVQLKERFWDLAKQLTDPLLEMGKEYTSPSIERSVLLRMGFSSPESAALVNACLEHNLLGHGAGHVVYKMSKVWSVTIRQAGQRLLAGQDWEQAVQVFKGGQPA